MSKPILIAEVKTVSPFGWQSDKSWDELFELAEKYGDWLSIHADERWGGNFDLIRKARAKTTKPILAKGLHKTDDEIAMALKMGADYVLVVGRVPSSNQEKCIIEPISIDELKNLPTAMKAVWNQRDLDTGQPKAETFAQARKAWPGWLVQASYLKSPADIAEGADAALVGTYLPEFTAQLQGK